VPPAVRWAALAVLAACACGLAGCGGDDSEEVHCVVDPIEACRCVLMADVFSDVEGCGADACENPPEDLERLMDHCAAKARANHAECEEMTAVMDCARSMDCVSDVVTDFCESVLEEHNGCQHIRHTPVCGGAPPAAGLPVLTALLAAICGLQA